ncbi:MAG: DUF1499 domain-containing protein [Rhizobiales bacterium]|nr:DUF1499 domain-containing protein [Hyphomicrobiales bacterium]
MKPTTVLLVILAFVAAACLAIALAGPARLWALFGNPDLGPVAFETLQRRPTPNDALACPPNTCAAPADITSPVFALTAKDLRRAFSRVVVSEDRIGNVAVNEATLEDRYVQRSRLMGFPDTINVKFVDLPGGRSSILIYSRSQLGRSDLGVNRARIERLLEKLRREVPPIT